jgi:hypothetical protein
LAGVGYSICRTATLRLRQRFRLRHQSDTEKPLTGEATADDEVLKWMPIAPLLSSFDIKPA